MQFYSAQHFRFLWVITTPDQPIRDGHQLLKFYGVQLPVDKYGCLLRQQFWLHVTSDYFISLGMKSEKALVLIG